MSHSLRITTVAEGIEDAEQAVRMRALGLHLRPGLLLRAADGRRRDRATRGRTWTRSPISPTAAPTDPCRSAGNGRAEAPRSPDTSLPQARPASPDAPPAAHRESRRGRDARRRPPGPHEATLGHLGEPAGRDVEDQTVDRDGPDPRVARSRSTCAPDGRLHVRERPEVDVEPAPVRSASVVAHPVLVGALEAAAVWPITSTSSVPRQLLADDQRADRVVGGEAARVADDVGVAGPQPERLLDVEPGVHAGEDRQPGQRRGGQRRAVERLDVAAVLGQDPAVFARRLAGWAGRSVTGSGGPGGPPPRPVAIDDLADRHLAVALGKLATGDPPHRPERARPGPIELAEAERPEPLDARDRGEVAGEPLGRDVDRRVAADRRPTPDRPERRLAARAAARSASAGALAGPRTVSSTRAIAARVAASPAATAAAASAVAARARCDRRPAGRRRRSGATCAALGGAVAADPDAVARRRAALPDGRVADSAPAAGAAGRRATGARLPPGPPEPPARPPAARSTGPPPPPDAAGSRR